MQVQRPGQDASLCLVFADGKSETLDITDMHAGQVFSHIRSRIQEKDMSQVLVKHDFQNKKVESRWGL